MLKSRETVERYQTRVLGKAVERGKVLGAFDSAVRTKPLARVSGLENQSKPRGFATGFS